jgi:TolB protein
MMVTGRWRSIVVAALVMSVAGCASGPASPPPATPTPGLLVPSEGPSASARASPVTSPSAAASAGAIDLPRPLGSSGTIALLGRDGALAVLGADGRTAILDDDDPSFAFPAWSPDGSRLAAVRTEATGTAIVVYDVAAALDGRATEATVVFRSPAMRPFYLAWTPDGADVSYLASSTDGLALRLARADATSPSDGTEPTSIVRTGDPFYFDWIGPDALVAHVGSGETAFLGEIDRSGASTTPAIERPAAFRSPVVSADGSYLAYARVGEDGPAVIVQARDGSSEVSMPVHAMAAVAFDPAGVTVASVGADEPVAAQLSLPLGPVRLLDPRTGDVRTLIEGAVVSFWWSPDGRTIAALRAQPIEGAESGQNEVRLLFVDVASGEIRSQVVVRPGQLYIDQFLTYFDQYAVSHEVWAPDGSSFLMPIVDGDGVTRVVAYFPDGSDPIAMDGVIGFWSPGPAIDP